MDLNNLEFHSCLNTASIILNKGGRAFMVVHLEVQESYYFIIF